MEGEIVVRMRRGERTTPGKGVVCQNDIPRPPLFRREIVLEDGLEADAHGVELDRWPRLLRQQLTLRIEDGGRAVLHLLHDERVGRTDHASGDPLRSEEHTSELQSLMRISYAVF